MIMSDENGVRVEYDIPEDVENRISEHFYYAMYGELCGVTGQDVMSKVSDCEEDSYYVTYITGTSGWEAAFFMACVKLDEMWLFDYYKQLPGYEKDIFEMLVAFRIVDTVSEKTNANSYYLYILDKEKLYG